jgi:hypothetical protein
MWSFKRDILKSINDNLTCYSVSFSTDFDAKSITYIDCEGNSVTMTIGGHGGYERDTVCLTSIVSDGGANVVYNGLCS